MKKILITGAAGFLGRHLCARYGPTHRVIGYDVVPTDTGKADEWIISTDDVAFADHVSRVSPDAVIHGAFVNRKPPQWSNAEYLNYHAVLNESIFESWKIDNFPLLLVSSSSVYGSSEHQLVEGSPINPVTIYGIAKVQQEMVARYYAQQDSLRLAVVRLFNLVGPGQKLGMLFPDWVKKAADILGGQQSSFEVVTLETSRDFLDVRDAAQAIFLLTENFAQMDSVYNVGSEQAVSLKEVFAQLQLIAGAKLSMSESQKSAAVGNPKKQFASVERLRKATGWVPQYSWQDSLKAVWDSYGRVSAEGED